MQSWWLGAPLEPTTLDNLTGDIYVDVVERTTIYLDPTLKRRLQEAASLRKMTEASIVREALEHYLSSVDRPRIKSIGASSDGGIAHRVDDALDELGFGRR